MDYYQHIRSEIRPLLPRNARKILEVGAGAGATLNWIKTIYPDAHTTAVEINGALREDLQRNTDVAIIGGVDESISRLKTYDLILILDVLEHLPNPEEILSRLSHLLEGDGRIIVSLPNIAHLSVSLPLLLRRKFTYQDAGIMDRTHLRFFVEESAVKLLNDAGLLVSNGIISGLQGPKARLLNALTIGILKHNLAKQYIMLGQLRRSGDVQNQVRWTIANQ